MSQDLPDDLSFEVPDDLSGLDSLGSAPEPSIALLLTQVAGAEPLVALCALAQVAADVVPSRIGAIAVLRERAGTAPLEAASAVSGLLQGSEVVLVTRSGSQLSASRWEGGERGADIPAGLLLDSAPADLEDLILGEKTIADLQGVADSTTLSRLGAMRALKKIAKKMRKEQ
ncbi:hypothetical protein ACTVCO_11430 [Sanguibacter sp. A247]|uniref:hypothetical protein n=1 Tax=unclassified Sanguibacter TaxID=2645534 RepID=UPI003FD6D4F4